MKKQLSFFFLFVCLIISFPLICYCESTGSIKGQVINQETKEPISGAVVIIKADEFERSVVTDKSGLYSIEGVKEKSVNIKVIHLDYFTKEVSNIELQKDSVTTINIEMKKKKKKKKKEDFVIYTPVHPDIKFDNLMLTIPTAYVIPKGDIRVQLTYDFNPHQFHFDLHKRYYEGSEKTNPETSVKRTESQGIRLNVKSRISEIGISVTRETWKAEDYYYYETGDSTAIYYKDYKREYEIFNIQTKYELLKETKYLPALALLFDFGAYKKKTEIEKPKLGYHEDLIYVIISKSIKLMKDFNLVMNFSSTPLNNSFSKYKTFGGVYLSIKERFKLGYENEMYYLTEYNLNESARNFRQASETKYYLIYDIIGKKRGKLQLQLCYSILKGSKYINFNIENFGFGLVYYFKSYK